MNGSCIEDFETSGSGRLVIEDRSPGGIQAENSGITLPVGIDGHKGVINEIVGRRVLIDAPTVRTVDAFVVSLVPDLRGDLVNRVDVISARAGIISHYAGRIMVETVCAVIE